jgi:hypothetical protein
MSETKETKAKKPKEPKAKKPKEPKAKKDTEQVNSSLGKAEIMRRKLASQPKVGIMIPLAPGEAKGATESVILNGHRVNILKGEYVMVPEQVARVIMEAQQQTREAIDNYFAMNSQGKSKAMLAKDAQVNSDNQ